VRSANTIALRGDHSLPALERQLLRCFHGHAVWALRDLLKKPERVAELTAAVMRDLGTPRSGVEVAPSPLVASNRLWLREELERMGERAFDVMSTSYQYLDLASGEFRLPTEVRDELCERCNFKTPNALVNYRKRQIGAIRSRLSSVA
jgi:hypothetical protein